MNGHQKIDNMRYGFNGIAGFTKFHSFQGNNYGVWQNIIRAEQHMNGQDVKHVISGDYLQGRQQLEWNFEDLQNNKGNVVEMQYYLSEDKNSAVGYVYNRTVNYRTAGVNSNCRSGQFGGNYLNFDQVTNFDWNSDPLDRRLKIIDLPNNEDYIFDFYSYPDGEYISSEIVNTVNNDKIKVKFPTLTKDRASVWFICKKVSGRNETNTNALNEEIKDENLIAYPNPTTGKIFIAKDQGEFEVYNSLGMKVNFPKKELDRDESILDFKGFAKGIYYIHFKESLKTIKICLL